MQQEQVVVPPPPQPPAPAGVGGQPVIVGPDGQIITLPGQASDPTAVYQAARAQRRELGEQLERLEDQRGELVRERTRQMEQGNPEIAKGIDQRIAEVDKRIAEVDKQLASADQAVARAAAIPGAVVEEPPRFEDQGPPDSVVAMSIVFMLVTFLPLSIAFARRIWRRATPSEVKMPAEWGERMSRLEQNVDTIAIEVERVSEGQRFMTKVLAESGRAIGGGPAQPVEVGAREAVPAPRNRG